MTNRVRFVLTGMLLAASIPLMTGCVAGEAGLAAPTAYGPHPSPKAGFTGLALPATMAPPSKTPIPEPGGQSAALVSRTTALTILYTNDTRGYVDPCG